jgi:pyridoxal phosphate enzyme (YggS family)
VSGERAAEISAGLAAVRTRVAAAARQAGRDPSDVTLVVVTKTFPATDVRLLAAQGVRDVGENRDQEAAAKAAACADLGLHWHFVGQLQHNKARSVARYAAVVHSVDRQRLVPALQRGADEAGRRLGCLVQVGLDRMTGRGGAPPAEVPDLADAVAVAPQLDLLGVMAVAPLGEDPAAAFARLAEVAAVVRARYPWAGWVSAGMSEDLEAAVAAGATHVRVGTAILGRRPPLR